MKKMLYIHVYSHSARVFVIREKLNCDCAIAQISKWSSAVGIRAEIVLHPQLLLANQEI